MLLLAPCVQCALVSPIPVVSLLSNALYSFSLSLSTYILGECMIISLTPVENQENLTFVNQSVQMTVVALHVGMHCRSPWTLGLALGAGDGGG